jgi:hypothetical protein
MAAAAMAGEIRIIFMTGLANPLVILESVRLLPGAQHSTSAQPTRHFSKSASTCNRLSMRALFRCKNNVVRE